MSTRMSLSRSSRTQSMTLLRRVTLYVSGEIGPGPKRPVRLVKIACGVPMPGKICPGSSYEMTDWVLVLLPLRRQSG